MAAWRRIVPSGCFSVSVVIVVVDVRSPVHTADATQLDNESRRRRRCALGITFIASFFCVHHVNRVNSRDSTINIIFDILYDFLLFLPDIKANDAHSKSELSALMKFTQSTLRVI